MKSPAIAVATTQGVAIVTLQRPPDDDLEPDDSDETMVTSNPFAGFEDDDDYEEADEPTRVMRLRDEEDSSSKSRPAISSFAVPKSSRPPEPVREPSARPSLYERLLRSGALDEVMEVAERESREALAGEDTVRAPGAKQPPKSTDTQPGVGRALVPPPRQAASSSPKSTDTAPGLGGPLRPRPLDNRLPASTPPGTEPGMGKPPLSVVEPLRDSEVDRLEIDIDDPEQRLSATDLEPVEPQVDAADTAPTPARKRRAVPPPPSELGLPSMMLSKETSSREDSTERIKLPADGVVKAAHNSLAPLGSVPAPPEEERKTPIIVWAAAAVVFMVAGGLLAVVNRPPEQPLAATAQPPAPAKPVAEVAPVVEEAVDEAAEATPAENEVAVEAADGPEDDQDEAERDKDAARRARRRAEAQAEAEATERLIARQEARRARREARRLAEEAERVPVAEAPTPVAKVDPPAPAAVVPSEPVRPAQALPETPSREQVRAAMTSIQPELARCAKDRHGVAQVSLTVRSRGNVSYAVVGGAFAGSPEGSCIAKAVKDAKFPAFSRPSFKVTYPVRL